MLIILNLDVEDTEGYLQVYFDVTNNSGEVIILEDLEPNTTMTLKM